MKTFLLVCVLLLAISCWAADISDDYLDEVLTRTNRDIRSMMKRDEKPKEGVNATRHYKKVVSREVLEIGLRSVVFAEASERIAREFNISRREADDILEVRAAPRPDFNANTACTRTVPACNTQTRYRTADGSCNNLIRPTDGMAVIRMRRLLPPKYSDGIQTFRRSVTNGGEALLSPRIISLIVHPDLNFLHNIVTTMVVGFGQFMDHDLTSTPENQNLQCCQNQNNPECMPIQVPANDDFYAQFGIGCLDIGRSIRACGNNPREQMNQNTAYIDGSMIYGSSITEQNNLRSMSNGMLLTDSNPRLLPKDNNAQNCGDPANGIICFRAGDGRLNENPGLTALHTLFLREHNRIAAQLKNVNPGWSDEILFQETRRIVVAELQHITYNEYLPVVLGQATMTNMFLTIPTGTGTTNYDSSIDASIINSFATAAYRFGHTLITNSMIMPGNGQFALQNNFLNPQVLYQDFNNIDRIVQGFSQQSASDFDPWMASAVTTHLFQRPGAQFGSDLASLNIQRGRDHGLATYNDFRQFCGESRLFTFSDLLAVTGSQEIVDRLQDAYRHVDDIDLWTGGICELPLQNAVVGPTFACIISIQFNRIKWGDRHFYTHANQAGSFTSNQLANLKTRTLASIACDNMGPTITALPQNTFVRGGANVACSSHPKLVFSNWKGTA